MKCFNWLKKNQRKQDKLDLILIELEKIRHRIGDLGLDVYCVKYTLSRHVNYLHDELIKK